MRHQIDINSADALSFLKQILTNSIMVEFTFNTTFTLTFVCNPEKTDSKVFIPNNLSLSILGNWWFGHKKKWIETVNHLTKDCEFIEPDEPVLAFKLAALRWNSNSTIIDIQIINKNLIIIFDNNEYITISNYSDEDSSWEIWDAKSTCIEDNNHFYVICEEGVIYYNIPE